MEAADRAHRGGRGEGVTELWEKLEAHRAFLESDGLLEERRRKNLAGEVFALASSRAKTHLQEAVADDAELRRLLDEVQARELDPLSAVREILEKVYGIGDGSGSAHSALSSSAAQRRLDGVARVTPVYPSETLSRRAGRSVQLKAENLQRTGAFKIRGAVNTIATSARRSARRALWRRAPATTGRRSRGRRGRPGSTRLSSCRRTRRWRRWTRRGTTAPGSSSSARASTSRWQRPRSASPRRARRSCTPSRTSASIAGQGTVGLEIVKQLPSVGTVVIPIGGGGLAAGIAIALRELRPHVRLVGVQAEAICPFAGGTEHRYTIAEGIAVKQPGTLTASILQDRWTTSSPSRTSRSAWPSCSSWSARSCSSRAPGPRRPPRSWAGKVPGDDEVCLVLSGGNIDPTLLIQVMRHGLTQAGRYLVLRTRIPDRPGELIKLLQLVAEERANIVSVEHHREGMALPIAETEVELTLATRDEAHCSELVQVMRARGYPLERLN